MDTGSSLDGRTRAEIDWQCIISGTVSRSGLPVAGTPDRGPVRIEGGGVPALVPTATAPRRNRSKRNNGVTNEQSLLGLGCGAHPLRGASTVLYNPVGTCVAVPRL